jgi:predicted secreted hydrolase
MRRIIVSAAVLAAVIVAALLLWPRRGDDLRSSLVSAAPPTGTTAFARAEGVREFVFPGDHGSHDDFQTEWWYYTGNLTSDGGEHFGYQLTFFRRALIPPAERTVRTSAWATDQVYMAHFALTDVRGNRHYSFEKLARGAGGVAGAQADPFRVWLEDWSVTGELAPVAQPYRAAPQVLRASAGEIAISLELGDSKGPVLQGERGYSRKGPEQGNASYYYSLTRIASEGSVEIAGRTYRVSGLSWMDHEFSTSALGAEQVGWDWFSIQLDNGSELMVFQLRRADGSVDQFSNGTLVAADGSTRSLGPGDFSLETTSTWRSPRTRGVYPAGWVLAVPSASLRLAITPYIPDQEMQVSYTYWEGAVRVEGEVEGQQVRGNGYVELTGYAGSMQGEF